MSEVSLVGHDIEFVLRSRPTADRDRISIVIWSDPPLFRQLTWRWFRPSTPETEAGRAEVYYAGSSVGSVALGRGGAAARLAFIHAGAHLVPSAFAIRVDGRDSSIRARITIDARHTTAIERLASTLPSESITRTNPFPAYADVLALRQVVAR